MTVVDEAKQDVQEIHDLIARDKKAAAAKWVRKFHRQARSLSRLPHRYDPVSEAEDVHRLWRQSSTAIIGSSIELTRTG